MAIEFRRSLSLWVTFGFGLALAAAPARASLGEEELRLRIARLALEQAERPSIHWEAGQRDCAGFVRFLFRSGVTGKSRMWLGRSGELMDFVRAEELVGYNFFRVSRDYDPSIVRTGDLLVFFSPGKPPADAWHLMVLLTGPRVLTIYHNGATGQRAALRKLWVDTLFEPIWTEWRPSAGNPRFMGIFRWKGFGDEGYRSRILAAKSQPDGVRR